MRALVRPPALLLACLLLLLHSRAHAGERESLKKLPGFYVTSTQSLGFPKGLEMRFSPEAIKDLEAKSRDDMTRIVEVELRKAGIRVFTKAEYDSIPTVPALVLDEVTIVDESVTMHTSSSLNVRQMARLPANGETTEVTTWSRTILTVLGSDTAQRTRGTVTAVQGMVEEFVNDYLAMNPKK